MVIKVGGLERETNNPIMSAKSLISNNKSTVQSANRSNVQLQGKFTNPTSKRSGQIKKLKTSSISTNRNCTVYQHMYICLNLVEMDHVRHDKLYLH